MLSKRALVDKAVEPYLHRNLDGCAPRFRQAVEDAIDDCESVGLDVVVNEGLRIQFVQEKYFSLGRDESGKIIDKSLVVTYAKSVLFSWHGLGLGTDVKSRKYGYFNDNAKAGRRWIGQVAEIFKSHGLDWGGDWIRKDLPHFQWGTLRAYPSDRARELFFSGGYEAVWREVGAL